MAKGNPRLWKPDRRTFNPGSIHFDVVTGLIPQAFEKAGITLGPVTLVADYTTIKHRPAYFRKRDIGQCRARAIIIRQKITRLKIMKVRTLFSSSHMNIRKNQIHIWDDQWCVELENSRKLEFFWLTETRLVVEVYGPERLKKQHTFDISNPMFDENITALVCREMQYK